MALFEDGLGSAQTSAHELRSTTLPILLNPLDLQLTRLQRAKKLRGNLNRSTDHHPIPGLEEVAARFQQGLFLQKLPHLFARCGSLFRRFFQRARHHFLEKFVWRMQPEHLDSRIL